MVETRVVECGALEVVGDGLLVVRMILVPDARAPGFLFGSPIDCDFELFELVAIVEEGDQRRTLEAVAVHFSFNLRVLEIRHDLPAVPL